MNNKGFTLVEVLAVVAILALIGTLTAPSVLNSLDLSKKTSDEVLVDNIKVALQTMYEENYYGSSEIYRYNNNGMIVVGNETDKIVKIEDNFIKTNIQTLVSNGFLTGINNEVSDTCVGSSSVNCNKKIIINSEKDDLGMCEVKITKIKNGNKVCYKVEGSNIGKCPTTNDFGGVSQCS